MEIKVFTFDQWNGSFNDCCKPFTAVDNKIYDHFLECLPPFYFSGGFAVSEAYSYDEKHEQMTYAPFYQWQGFNWFLGDICKAERQNAIDALKLTYSDIFEA